MKTNGKPRLRARRGASTLKLAALAFAAAVVLFCVAALTTPSRTSAAPPDPVGSITVRAGNYIGTITTETFTVEKQIYTGSTNCSSGGGAVTTVSGIDQATGHSIPLAPTDSVLLTIPISPVAGGAFSDHVSEQNGPFVSWSTDSMSLASFPGSFQICARGPSDAAPHNFIANFYAGIELFDSCGVERYLYRPGEAVTIRVTGSVLSLSEQPRLIAAGGTGNECAFVPPPPDFTTINTTTDPFVYTFTLPATDAEIPASCVSGGTQHVTGNWRVVTYDVPGCGCNRNTIPFQVQSDAPIPSCPLTGCPADIEQAAAANACGANVNFTPPTGGPGESVSCDHAPGTFFPVGTTAVTCTSSPGGSECSFDVKVTDATAPTIAAPANVAAFTDPGDCSATGLTLGTPTTSDNCSVASVTNDAPAQFPVGTTTVTWTVKDAAGNPATATQQVVVTDAEKPTITAPPAVSVNAAPGSCEATGVALGSPTTGDNCGVLPVTNNAPASFPVGATVITWTVTDVHGNTATATQTVTVVDAEPPHISNITASPSVLWPPNHSMRDVALAYTATDNCRMVSCSVTGVTSNEPVDGTGDGDTSPDFEVVGPTLVRLRAERSGSGSGRQYTVTVTCSDGTNSASRSVDVNVPKSQKK